MQHNCIHSTFSFCGIAQVFSNYYNMKLYKIVKLVVTGWKL